MPTTRRKMPHTRASILFNEILRLQGLKKGWIANAAGMTLYTLTRRMREYPGHPWQPGEREKIAAALLLPAACIWHDMPLPGVGDTTTQSGRGYDDYPSEVEEEEEEMVTTPWQYPTTLEELASLLKLQNDG